MNFLDPDRISENQAEMMESYALKVSNNAGWLFIRQTRLSSKVLECGNALIRQES